MGKTQINTVVIRHGLTRIYTVFNFFSVTSVSSVAKKLCGQILKGYEK
jgi:hypothetical protein